MKSFLVSICLLLFSSVFLISCSEAPNPALDSLEELVGIYENFVEETTAKGNLCASEYTDFMTESSKKILEMREGIESQELSSKDASRYLDIQNRMQEVFVGLAELSEKVTIDFTC